MAGEPHGGSAAARRRTDPGTAGAWGTAPAAPGLAAPRTPAAAGLASGAWRASVLAAVVGPRLDDILGDLDLPVPFELANFLARVEKLRSRPIDLRPFRAPPGGPSGVWIGARHADYVFYDQAATTLHRTHIVVHEIAHMLLGHHGIGPADRDLIRIITPDPNADLIALILGRNGLYQSPREREAEYLASIILERASQWNQPSSTRDQTPRPSPGQPRKHCAYRRLRPLWQAVRAAVPEIALPPGPSADIGYRLYRRVIEIRDGQLALRPYSDPQAVAMAESEARSEGVTGADLEATIEAALLATAISARESGLPRHDDPDHLPPMRSGEQLADEVGWLIRVSQMFARSPIVHQFSQKIAARVQADTS